MLKYRRSGNVNFYNQFENITNALMANAESFHNSLYLTNNQHISSVKTPNFIYSSSKETTTRIEHTITISYDSMGVEHINSSFSTEELAIGDGLVPKWSATLGGEYSNNSYVCTGNNTGHTTLLDNSDVQNFIINNIRKEYVYQETATFKKGYE